MKSTFPQSAGNTAGRSKTLLFSSIHNIIVIALYLYGAHMTSGLVNDYAIAIVSLSSIIAIGSYRLYRKSGDRNKENDLLTKIIRGIGTVLLFLYPAYVALCVMLFDAYAHNIEIADDGLIIRAWLFVPCMSIVGLVCISKAGMLADTLYAISRSAFARIRNIIPDIVRFDSI